MGKQLRSGKEAGRGLGGDGLCSGLSAGSREAGGGRETPTVKPTRVDCENQVCENKFETRVEITDTVTLTAGAKEKDACTRGAGAGRGMKRSRVSEMRDGDLGIAKFGRLESEEVKAAPRPKLDVVAMTLDCGAWSKNNRSKAAAAAAVGGGRPGPEA